MSDLTPGFERPQCWTDRDSLRSKYLELYRELDYIPAYAAHSELRMEQHGPQGCIGSPHEWDTHGAQQLEFLLTQAGLEPWKTLLDVGCGTGRLARKAVPYLAPGHYTGVDIAEGLLDAAEALSEEEGWDIRAPEFILSRGGLRCLSGGIRYDVVWAHSVFTHLPPGIIQEILTDLSGMGFGAFFFTYRHADLPRRSGLKQFQYPAAWLMEHAEDVGLKAEPIDYVFHAQRTMKVVRA